jgi:DNA-binding transcriptional LysR family regulator
MEPQWDDMRIFLAVARTESLSGAGRQLKVDPATVGRRIARLEEALGAPLFAKSPQGYAPTDAGQRLLAHAEHAEQAMQGAVEELSGNSGQLSGQIRIGAPDGCANFILPQVCADISDQNPDLDIQIVALPRVFNLSKREADLAIGVSQPTAGRLSVQKITDYTLSLYAARFYLRNSPPIETLEDLKHHKIVGYIPDMIFDKELDYFSELGLDRIHLGSNSASVQTQMVRAGHGVGIVHDFAIGPGARRMVRILPDDFRLTRSFYLIRHQDDRRLERMNRFADALISGIKEEVHRLESDA